MSLEDPEQGFAQPRAPIEARHAVVVERVLQVLDELSGKRRIVGVHRAQVGQQVLLAHEQIAADRYLDGRLGREERADVHKRRENFVLEGLEFHSLVAVVLRDFREHSRNSFRRGRIDVETEEEGLQLGERLHPADHDGFGAAVDLELNPLGAVDGRDLGSWLDLDEGIAGVDLDVCEPAEPLNGARKRRHDAQLHLHRLDRHERISGSHDVARRDGIGDDDGRRRRLHDSLIVAHYAMGEPVDLEEMANALARPDHAVGLTLNRDAALVLIQDLDCRVVAVRVGVDAVSFRSELEYAERVHAAVVSEFDLATDLGPDLGTAARRELVEVRLLEGELVLIDEDRGLKEGDIRKRARACTEVWSGAVEPIH